VTEWFPVSIKPVNGGPKARYQHRCRDLTGGRIKIATKEDLLEYHDDKCTKCRWRGLTAPAEAKGGGR
jgi:hypothetical protein